MRLLLEVLLFRRAEAGDGRLRAAEAALGVLGFMLEYFRYDPISFCHRRSFSVCRSVLEYFRDDPISFCHRRSFSSVCRSVGGFLVFQCRDLAGSRAHQR